MIYRITSGEDLTSESKDQLWSSSGWVAMHIFEVFILCYACSITKMESKQIGCNLHHFALKCDDYRCKAKVHFNKVIENIISIVVFLSIDKGILNATSTRSN